MSDMIDAVHHIDTQPHQRYQVRSAFNFQTLTQYLSSFTTVKQPLKYFQSQGQKYDIVLQIPVHKEMLSIFQKIHIDRRRLTYFSRFLLKINSQIVCCPTKCLRLMIIKELESLKKKMRIESYTLTVDQSTGEIVGKHIFSIGPSTNINELLMCELVPFRSYMGRFMAIVLSLMNMLPPLYSEALHEKTKVISEVNIEEKIERRIYKYYHFSIIELWKSYSKAPSDSLEEPEDKELQEKLENEVPIGFNQESSEMFVHRQKSKYRIPYKFEITTEENATIQIHLKIPMGMPRKSESNFIFNEIKVLQESSEAIDTGLRGASTKIMISKLKFVYMNSMNNPIQNHNHREVAAKEYTKLVGIKVPLQKVNLDRAKKKSDHEIKILKMFSEAESPFLLRYFVCHSPTFKYSNMLMMSFLNNCETISSFMAKKKETLSFTSKLYVLINVLQALRLIKDYNVVHMDLSPSNVLVNPNYITQLIDFGESYHQQICTKNYNPGYTLPFSFPEKFTLKHFNSKSDIFSFGVLAFYCMFRSLPYNPSQKLVEALRDYTYTSKFLFAPESVEYYGYRKMMIFLFSFIQRCMDPDPLIRPHPGWSIVLFKELYFWLEEVSMNF